MDRKAYNAMVIFALIVIIFFILMALSSPLIVEAAETEPEVVEIVTIYDAEGNRGMATISHVRATFSIEVVLPDGEVIKVENWRTAKYDLNDVIAVSDKIHCAGMYFPPKYFKHNITRKIFLKATR